MITVIALLARWLGYRLVWNDEEKKRAEDDPLSWPPHSRLK
jgi:hypothetical protein